MTPETCQFLTGQEATEAQIRRVRVILEGLLGFTLDPNKRLENLYDELGKSPRDCFCPDTQDLEPPDPVEFGYRLFPYNKKDKYFHVDPFTDLAAVKLVKGNITVKELTDCQIRPEYKQGWAKFIQRCPDCYCELDCCTDCLQLAVDANWVGGCETSPTSPGSLGDELDESLPLPCLPDELLMVWADSIGNFIDCNKDVKSERIGSHSYTRFDRTDAGSTGLNLHSSQLAILRKYAGPFGTLTKVITV